MVRSHHPVPFIMKTFVQIINELAVIEREAPHVCYKIELMWGSDNFSKWLYDTYLIDTRGNRAGFSQAVFDALLQIQSKCKEVIK